MHSPNTTRAPDKRKLTPEQLDLKHAVQDTWEQLEGNAHTAGRLVARFARQLPPLYMGQRNDHKLLKPGQHLGPNERIVSLETMATGVFKGEGGGQKLSRICSQRQAERLMEAIKAAGLISARRVPTWKGWMTAYTVNVAAITAEDDTALRSEIASRKAEKRVSQTVAVSDTMTGRYPTSCRGGIRHGVGTNSHTQVTPLTKNNRGAERMEAPTAVLLCGSASPMDGASPQLASLASPERKGHPHCASPPPGTAKPVKLLNLEHGWLKGRERAGFKRIEWTNRDHGAVKQMQKWWARSEFGRFDAFLSAVPGMWRDILPVFSHMTNNPPPKAPCIRFVWANIDAFAQAYQEGASTFAARIKAPLSKDEKRAITAATKSGLERKAAVREVYKSRWPKAQGLGMLRLRQDQKRTRRKEAEAAEAKKRQEAEEVRAVQAIGQIARALAPKPEPAPAPKEIDWGLFDAAMKDPVAARAVERFREYLQKCAVPPETDEQMNAALRNRMKERFNYLSRGLTYEERRLRPDAMTADFPGSPSARMARAA